MLPAFPEFAIVYLALSPLLEEDYVCFQVVDRDFDELVYLIVQVLNSIDMQLELLAPLRIPFLQLGEVLLFSRHRHTNYRFELLVMFGLGMVGWNDSGLVKIALFLSRLLERGLYGRFLIGVAAHAYNFVHELGSSEFAFAAVLHF